MNVNAEMTKLDSESLVGSGEQTSIETDVGLRGIAAVLTILSIHTVSRASVKDSFMNVSAQTMKLDCLVERITAPASIGKDVGLRGMAAVLPIHTRDLEELQRSKLLVSDRSALEELGFEKVHVCDATHDINWLALESARRAMGEA